ncbi:hypothetical protein GUITHDRAFT_104760 [Guillardia theta CCMP2712]|uniref:Uncharacterized protein n=3 Tax=Guillardia theta TaxID=55529 RepID=L1JL36_GUITC|nr:hypothetical protein GUITHDRAFT_104760 [Guillardia theta CCMP2712]EKX49231.1 hypothetical protein GUITHDRAFT_104760 [Guillardia theta CCMP2712]|eukprot:XP_005836211.1 hypothetical protein GUITHDRAFT_104760 [Guillardia theta CCMP2712]
MKILKYAELQEDHLNPTDFAKSMNSMAKFELMCQAAFSAAILVYFALDPARGLYLKLIMIGVNAGYLFFLFARLHLVQSYYCACPTQSHLRSVYALFDFITEQILFKALSG